MSRWDGLTAKERFWSKVNKTATCWLWTGASMGAGRRYGSLSVGGRMTSAHRFSYEIHNGPIPEGMVIDHICHSGKCVRPDHLQAVTHKQNLENLPGANRTSKSGVRGVWWVKANRKWKAEVQHDRKGYHVGMFTDLKEAEAAVIAKRNELFSNNLIDRMATK